MLWTTRSGHGAPGPLPSVLAPVALTVTVTSLHQRRSLSSRERRRCRGARGPRLPLSIMHLLKVCQACSTRGSNAASWATRHALDPLICWILLHRRTGFLCFHRPLRLPTHPQAATSAPTVVALAIVLVCAAASEPFVLRTRCVPAFAPCVGRGQGREGVFLPPQFLRHWQASVSCGVVAAAQLPRAHRREPNCNRLPVDHGSQRQVRHEHGLVRRSTEEGFCCGCSNSSGWCAGTCPKGGGSCARVASACCAHSSLYAMRIWFGFWVLHNPSLLLTATTTAPPLSSTLAAGLP